MKAGRPSLGIPLPKLRHEQYKRSVERKKSEKKKPTPTYEYVKTAPEMSVEYKVIVRRFKMNMRISDIAEDLKISSKEVQYIIDVEQAEIDRQRGLKSLIILDHSLKSAQ